MARTLHLICGRAGSGKSNFLLEQLRRLSGGEGKTVLLVPEQFSHESERELTSLLGNELAARVEVLSFKRLADSVFRETGFAALSYLDDGGRNLLLAKALSILKDDLKVYARAALRPELTGKLLAQIGEFKAYGVTVELLSGAAEQLEPGALRDKLRDLCLIYGTYEGLLKDSFADPADDLTRLCMALENSAVYRDYHFFLDAFKGFTPQEFGVLGNLMDRCASLWVGLCRGGDAQEEQGVFRVIGQTQKKLCRMAEKRGLLVEETILPPGEGYRPEISFLERRLFASSRERFEAPCPALRLFGGQDIFTQAEYAARNIQHLVYEEGYRYGDFVVITRDMDRYGDVFETIFQKHGIGLYMDRKDSLMTKPVIALLLSALDVISGGFLYEDVFSYLRTYLTNLWMEEIDLLETYAYLLGIKREGFLREFTFVPRQLLRETGEEEEKLLGRINELRLRFVQPLLELREQSGQTAERITKAVYKLLIDLGVPGNIERIGDKLTAQGAVEEAAEYGQLWELLMDALDQLVLVAGSEKMDCEQYGKLLKVMLGQYHIGSIPMVHDRVTLGSAERIRVSGEKCVFLVGFNDGVFPKSDFEEGLLSDTQKKKLEDLGLELAAGGRERIFEELFYVYCAVTAASDKLFITWCEDGKEQRPSYLLERVRELFPQIVQDGQAFFSDARYLYAGEAAFDYMLGLPRTDPLYASLHEYFDRTQPYAARLQEIRNANRKAAELRFQNARIPRELYGEDLKLSPTRVELFENCRFAHFMRYGLLAEERRQISFDALETGTFLHYVLEHFTARFDDDFLKPESAPLREQAADEIVSSYVSEVVHAQSGTRRFQYLFRRLRALVRCVCEFLVEEFRQSRFRPVDFELRISDEGQVQPIRVRGEDFTVRVVGKVDRVDGYEKDGQLYLRVVDYKTGSKQFKLADVCQGMSLQMLLYLFSIGENGTGHYGKEVRQAGVLYMPATYEAVGADPGTSREQIEKEHQKMLRMSGLLLDEEEVLRAMEPTLGGRFIPVSVKKDGTMAAYSSVASEKQFGLLRRHAEKLLLDMGKELLSGELKMNPFKQGADSCEYCEYRAACRFDVASGTGRRYQAIKDAEIWNLLGEEERHVDK